uniref:Genome polyprotein n=1 Tax=Bavovirus sp. TaxID=2809180 RepID=A0A8F5PHH2_9CALI|nr:MAG: polyprotein [Bavovirus sp.]
MVGEMLTFAGLIGWEDDDGDLSFGSNHTYWGLFGDPATVRKKVDGLFHDIRTGGSCPQATTSPTPEPNPTPEQVIPNPPEPSFWRRLIDGVTPPQEPPLLSAITSLISLLGGLANLTFTALVEKVKPVALLTILRAHGWRLTIPCLTAVLELYGMVRSTTDLLVDGIGWFIDFISRHLPCKLQAGGGEDSDTDLEELYTAENPSRLSPRVLQLIGAVVSLPVALLLGRAACRPILRFLGSLSRVNTVATFIKNVASLVSWGKNQLASQRIRRTIGGLIMVEEEVARHINNSTAPQLEAYSNTIDQLLEEARERQVSHPGHPLLSALTKHASDLKELQNQLRGKLSLLAKRDPPAFYLFTGPPGIGKTTLVQHLAARLSPIAPSNFPGHLDHYDTYNPGPVCIWDEMTNTPPDLMVQHVLGMVNSTPYPLNCDRPENKGMVFNSRVVFATSNLSTPLDPGHPLAGAFYRRVQIIDCSAPAISNYITETGEMPPSTHYRQDGSHITLKKRPRMAYTPQGDLLTSDGVARKGRVTPTTPDAILTSLRGTVVMEAGRRILLVVDKNWPEALPTSWMFESRGHQVDVIVDGPETNQEANVLILAVMNANDWPAHRVAGLLKKVNPALWSLAYVAGTPEVVVASKRISPCDLMDHVKRTWTAPQNFREEQGWHPDWPAYYAKCREAGRLPGYILLGIDPALAPDLATHLHQWASRRGIPLPIYDGTKNPCAAIERAETEILTAIVMVKPTDDPDLKVTHFDPTRPPGLSLSDVIQTENNEALEKFLGHVWAPGTISPHILHRITPACELDVSDSSTGVGAVMNHFSLASGVRVIWQAWKNAGSTAQFFQTLLTMAARPEPRLTVLHWGDSTYWLYTSTCVGFAITPRIAPHRLPGCARPRPAGDRSLYGLLSEMLSTFLTALRNAAPLILTLYSWNQLNSTEMEKKKGKTKHGRGRRHAGGGRGPRLTDEDYDEWQQMREDWREDVTAEQYYQAKYGENRDTKTSQRYDAWRRLKDLRAGQNDPRMSRPETRREAGLVSRHHGLSRQDLGFATSRAERRLATYDASNPGDDEAPRRLRHHMEGGITSPVVPALSGSLEVGWAVHLGSGRFILPKHLGATTIAGHPFVVCGLRNVDLLFVDCQALRSIPQVRIGTGHPVKLHGRGYINASKTTATHLLPVGTVQGYSYNLLAGITKQGDCGLPLYDAAGGVVGIHVARNQVGSICLAYQQLTEAAARPLRSFRGLDVVDSEVPSGPPMTVTRYWVAPGMEFDEQMPYQPGLVGSNDPRNPAPLVTILTSGLAPYTDPGPDIPPAELALARAQVTAALQALIGVEVSPNLDFAAAWGSLNKDTSCGPLVPGKKRDYMDEAGNLLPGTLRDHLSTSWGIATTGKALRHIYALALKDELLPRRKIYETPKKRLLWGCDAGVALAAAGVFQPVYERIKATAAWGPISVGICLERPEVFNAFQHRFTGPVSCLDYSGWDSTMHHAVITAAVEILSVFAEDTPLTHSVVSTLTSPAIGCFMGCEVTVKRGLPSGQPGTSMINSVCHMLYFCMALNISARGACLPPLQNPILDCELATYGDDCIYKFPTLYQGAFGNFIQALRTLGLKPTAPDKTSDIALGLRIVYLKRELRDAEGNWRDGPVLDLDSIVRQAYWVRGTAHRDPREVATRVHDGRGLQLDLALAALSQHGPEVFSQNVHPFIRTALASGCPISLTTWEVAHQWWKDFSASLSTAEGDITTLVMSPKVDYVMEGVTTPPAPRGQAPTGTPQTTQELSLATSGMVVTAPDTGVPVAPQPVAPQAPTIIEASGGITTLPPDMASMFVQIGRLGWNGTNPTGTMLGTFDLGPALNPFTRLISQAYCAWGGGFEFQVMLSGSGAYGGRLLIGIFPPGINPGNQDPTAFPHFYVDARESSPVTFPVPDLNPARYHSTTAADLTTSVAIFVAAPLLNPFSANNGYSCEITVLARPGPDFGFAMLRTPTTTEVTVIRDALGRSTAGWLGCRWATHITSITPFLGARDTRVYNHFTSQGTTAGWGNGWPYTRIYVNIYNTSTNRPGTPGTGVTAGQFLAVQAAPDSGQAPTVIPGIPPGWTDLPTSQVTVNQGADPTAGSGAMYVGVFATHVNGSGPDIAEAFSERFFQQNGMIASGTTSATIISVPNNVSNQTLAFAIGETRTGAPASNAQTIVASCMCWFTASNTSPGDNALTVPGYNGRAAPYHHTILSFNSHVPTNYPGGGTIGSSQPVPLSSTLAANPSDGWDSTRMAVWNLSGGGYTWQMGMLSDGTMVTGNFTGTVSLTTPHEISFQGFSSITAPLQPPTPNGNDAAFRLVNW